MSCPWSPPRGRSVTARTVFSLPAGPRRAQRSRTLLVIHRTCPSGKSGGSLGEFGPGQMVKEFNDVVFTTGKVGKVEGPVKTQFGYHLILITKRGDESM